MLQSLNERAGEAPQFNFGLNAKIGLEPGDKQEDPVRAAEDASRILNRHVWETALGSAIAVRQV